MTTHPNPSPGKQSDTVAEAQAEAALAQLVGRVKAGDQEALGQLYSHTRPAVLRYLTRRMDVCPADVEDVAQETFLRVPQMADTFNPNTTAVQAWLCGRVAHWTLTDHYRKQRYRQHSAVDAAIDTARRSPFEPAHERESRPLSPRVVHALARLTPAQRRAIQLRYLDGHSNQTAAQVAQSTPGAVAASCADGRKRLAKELGELAQQPVSWAASVPQTVAMRAALAETGDDVPAALKWLASQGVTVDESYAYKIRNGHRSSAHHNPKDTAVREQLAQLGACDAATVQTRLRERGIEVSKSYINHVRAEVGAPLPTNKNTAVRAAIAELGTSHAATVQAHLRERGIETSQSYINQVHRTPTTTAPAAGRRSHTPQNPPRERAGRSAPHRTVTAEAGAARTEGGEGADQATAAVARARAALAQIPAARASSPDEDNTRIGAWRGHDHCNRDHSDQDEQASSNRDQLGVNA